MKTMQQKKTKMVMQAPDLSVSKANQERADKLIGNFLNATERQVKEDIKSFSTTSAVWRLIKKDKTDPSQRIILETIKRMEKDKIHSQVGLQISEITGNKLQAFQQSMIFKMIPYLVGLLGISILTVLVLTTKPLDLGNPVLQRYLLILGAFIPLFIWGLVQRKKAKIEMLSTNILLQAATAYASAKMQGKGQVGALQNLAEMKRRAKSLEKNPEKKKEANNKLNKKKK